MANSAPKVSGNRKNKISLKTLTFISAEAYNKCVVSWLKCSHACMGSKKKHILKTIIQICIKIIENVLFFLPVRVIFDQTVYLF